jgi:hypothetical protein
MFQQVSASPFCIESRLQVAAKPKGFVIVITLLALWSAALQANAQQQTPPKLAEHAQTMPLQFVRNQGQDATRAGYLAQGPGYSMRLFSDAAEISLARPHREASTLGKPEAALTEKATSLKMEFLGARENATLDADSPLPGVMNYFKGPDQSRWFPGLPTYGQVRYHDIYPGVDLTFHSDSLHGHVAQPKYGSKVEYDFQLQPHARLDQVAIALNGADKARLDGSGNLDLTIDKSQVRFLKPIAWQGSEHRTVEASYKLTPARGNKPATIGFEVADYDPTESLVIDPVLDFAAGLNLYTEYAMTADSAGNTYVVGADPTNSLTAFDVLKFNTSGALVYTTVIAANTSGTYGYGFASGIAVNSSGNVFVAGGAGAAWPTTSGAYQTANGYDGTGYTYNAYLVELSRR